MTEPSYTVVSYLGKDLPINYRGFVFNNWLRTYKAGSDWMKNIDKDAYFTQYRKFLENLSQKPGFLIKLAVLTDDHDVVLGFSASREDVLDYVYVQYDCRGQKIAKSLLPEGITTFSHITRQSIPIWQAKFKEWKFNPFA